MTGPVVKTEGFTHMYGYIKIGAENMWELRTFFPRKKKRKKNITVDENLAEVSLILVGAL